MKFVIKTQPMRFPPVSPSRETTLFREESRVKILPRNFEILLQTFGLDFKHLKHLEREQSPPFKRLLRTWLRYVTLHYGAIVAEINGEMDDSKRFRRCLMESWLGIINFFARLGSLSV